MPLLLPFEKISEADLQLLCDQACPESQTLDFKRDLPGRLDQDKQEFAKDVAALANTDGGDIVFGVQEADGCAERLSLLSKENADEAMRRLLQIIEAGIEPRLHVQIRHVECTGGYALLVRVPRSFVGPHCIRVNAARRFVMRNGVKNVDLTFEQVRTAFDRTATLAERARQFISHRRRLVESHANAQPIREGPILLMHLIPMAGLSGSSSINLSPLNQFQTLQQFYNPSWHGGFDKSFNLDGLVVHSNPDRDHGSRGYCHLFRTGAVEFAELGGHSNDAGMGLQKVIVSSEITRFYTESLNQGIGFLKVSGFSGPAVLGISLLHTTDFELVRRQPVRGAPKTDRPHLQLPESWINELETVNIDETLRPLMDVVWQAFGLGACTQYDPSGKYKPDP